MIHRTPTLVAAALLALAALLPGCDDPPEDTAGLLEDEGDGGSGPLEAGEGEGEGAGEGEGEPEVCDDPATVCDDGVGCTVDICLPGEGCATRGGPGLGLLGEVASTWAYEGWRHVAAAPSGELYVAVGSYETVIRFDAAGAFDGPLWGDADPGATNPFRVAFGPDGLLYVASWSSDDVRRFQAATGLFVDVFVPAGTGGLTAPSAMAFDASGDLYVGDADGDRVLRFGTGGGLIGEFVAPSAGGLDHPAGLTFDAAGDLYVSSRESDQVLRYAGADGSFIEEFAATGAPADLLFDASGELYVASLSLTDVKRFDSGGAPLGDLGVGGYPKRAAASVGGILHVLDGDDELRAWDTTHETLIGPSVADPGLLPTHGGECLAVGDDGLLYVGSEYSGTVQRFDRTTGDWVDTLVPGTPNAAEQVRGCDFLPSGALAVIRGQSIEQWDPISATQVGPTIPASAGDPQSQPVALAAGPDGLLYSLSWADENVVRFDPSSGAFVDEVVSPGIVGTGRPKDLAFGPDGDLYVSFGDPWALDSVVRFDGTTFAMTLTYTQPPGPAWVPRGLAFDDAGDLYVADTGGGTRVARFDRQTATFIDEFADPPLGPLSHPTAVTFGPGDELFLKNTPQGAYGTPGHIDHVYRFDGPAEACDSPGPCQSASCDDDGSCLVEDLPDGTDCDDGAVCTTDDACIEGLCVGIPEVCDDGDPCTVDYCAAPDGCGARPTVDPACAGEGEGEAEEQVAYLCVGNENDPGGIVCYDEAGGLAASWAASTDAAAVPLTNMGGMAVLDGVLYAATGAELVTVDPSAGEVLVVPSSYDYVGNNVNALGTWDGQLVVVSSAGGTAHRLDVNGDAIEPPLLTGATTPQGFVQAQDGTGYAVDSIQVWQITDDGGGGFDQQSIHDISAMGAGWVSDGGITFALGHVWYADHHMGPGPGHVVAVDPATGVAAAVIEAPGSPRGLAVDPGGQHMYVSLQGAVTVDRIPMATALAAPPLAPFLVAPAELHGPFGVAWVQGPAPP